MKTRWLWILFILSACSEQEPDVITGTALFPDNWIVFEFRGGQVETSDGARGPYMLVSAIDAVQDSSLVLDNLYGAGVRIRAAWSDSSFSAMMTKQLEPPDTNIYGIEYTSVKGYVTENPVLTQFMYDMATEAYEDINFYPEDIRDVIFLRAGFYDQSKEIIDTVLIIGYRKTGFENSAY